MSHHHGGMDMSGMSGMGGMDMGSTGLFQKDNMKIARSLWYIVAAVVGVLALRALTEYVRLVVAKRASIQRSNTPSRPTNALWQLYDTLITSLREISYPASRPFRGAALRHFTPPSFGKSALILTYWTIILIMLWSNVLLGPGSSLYGYRWEKPAFRAGWVSITQVPLLYALSCKFNVISILTGVSYERLNWLHRWVARTLFLTVIVHWAYFLHEWMLADFVDYQLEIMPMVKYGFGAWALIGWSVLTGFGLFRDLCYEFWLVQHLATAGVLLWVLYVHVPSYAQYNIWLAIGFVAFDRIARGLWSLASNLHLRAFGKGGIGFHAEAIALSGGYLRLTVKNVDFDWRPGQHIFLSIPACGVLESHPFTIANMRSGPSAESTVGDEIGSLDLDVFLKCHSGFTKRLQKKACNAKRGSVATYRVFLSGPWGTPPLTAIERSNSLIFIAASTGASFTVPLMEYALKKAPYVQRLCFYWIVRDTCQLCWFDNRLRAAMRQLANLGLEDVTFKIYITSSDAEIGGDDVKLPSDTISEVRESWLRQHGLPIETSAESISESEEIRKGLDTSNQSEKGLLASINSTDSTNASCCGQTCGCKSCKCKPTLLSPSFTVGFGRPQSFDPLIRPTVEAATGETFVVACGGRDMMAQIRTYVAGLSDERAVHKGTGAQGIRLWTESYGW